MHLRDHCGDPSTTADMKNIIFLNHYLNFEGVLKFLIYFTAGSKLEKNSILHNLRASEYFVWNMEHLEVARISFQIIMK